MSQIYITLCWNGFRHRCNNNFNQIWIFLIEFHKSPQYRIQCKSVEGMGEVQIQTDIYDEGRTRLKEQGNYPLVPYS